MRFPYVAASIVVVVAISGCQKPAVTGEVAIQQDSKADASIDQANLCEATEWTHDSVASECTPGQKVVFLPKRWGNEQLPIFFAAVNCDLRYSVALTNGGVACIYGPITPTPPRSADPAQQTPTEPGTP